MYQRIKDSDSIKRISDGAFIPADPANTDYAAYLAWLAEGNTPEPFEEVTLSITSVTMRQARLALLAAGLLDDINAAIESLPSPRKEAARIEWGYSTHVQRHNGLVSALAPALELSESQIDDLFSVASKL